MLQPPDRRQYLNLIDQRDSCDRQISLSHYIPRALSSDGSLLQLNGCTRPLTAIIAISFHEYGLAKLARYN